jgi:hypothetical protein
MIADILIALVLAAVCMIITLGSGCWVRSHDGTMTSEPEIEADITEDL